MKLRKLRVSPLWGPWFLVITAVLFAVVAMLVKLLKHIPGPEVGCVRFAFGLACCWLWSWRVTKLRPVNKRGLWWRGLWGGLSSFFFYVGMPYLRMSMATLLLYSGAPVISVLYGRVFLKERVSRPMAAFLSLSIVGLVLVVLRTPDSSGGLSQFGLVVGILSAVCAGISVATIREVRKTDGHWEIFQAFCWGGVAITLPPTCLHWVSPSLGEWGLLVLVAVIAVVPQLLMSYALKDVGLARAGVIAQLTPVVGLLLGIVKFDEWPGTVGWVGAALTIGGVVLSMLFK